MNLVSFGLAIRALRRRRGWTQAELGERSATSQSAVSRCEGGKGDALTWRTIVRIAEALGARASVAAYWQGEDLARLLDAAHAGLVDRVVQILTAADWEVVPEATFSIYGERGSIDLLAYHAPTGALLVIEVKSAVPDMQGMLSALDRKVRLAPRIASERGWVVNSVSRLLVIGEDRTSRRRLEDHAATVNQLMPLRTVAMRRWLAAPSGPVGGVLFLTPTQSTTARRRIRGHTSRSSARSGSIPANEAPRSELAILALTATRPVTDRRIPRVGIGASASSMRPSHTCQSPGESGAVEGGGERRGRSGG